MTQPPDDLDAETKARIDAEERYRAQARKRAEAEANTPVPEPTPTPPPAPQGSRTPTVFNSEAQATRREAEQRWDDLKRERAIQDAAQQRWQPITAVPGNMQTTRKSPSAGRVVLILLGLIVGGAIVSGIATQLTPSATSASQTAPDTTPVDTYTKDDFAIQCQDNIEKLLKAPATAKFASPWDDYITDDGKGGYIYKGYVDAENSFSALIRTNFECTYNEATGNVHSELLEGDN